MRHNIYKCIGSPLHPARRNTWHLSLVPKNSGWICYTVQYSFFLNTLQQSGGLKQTIHTLGPRVGGIANKQTGMLILVCDVLTCPGIAIPVHGTVGLSNHCTRRNMSTQSCTVGWVNGGEECGKRIFMSQFEEQTHIYRVFVGNSRSSCMKILHCRLNPRTWVWNYLRAETWCRPIAP